MHVKNVELEHLSSELENIAGTLDALRTQNKVARVVAAEEDAALIQKYIQQVDRALLDYQVRSILCLLIDNC